MRSILEDWLQHRGYIDTLDHEISGLSEEPRTLSNAEDAAINAMYASGKPGVGAQFLRAIINHMRSELRRNPDITVDEVKEFVLDLFDDYGQDLEQHLKK